MDIRLLEQKDGHDFRSLRLEALQTYPEYFVGSFEEEAAWSDAQFMTMLQKSAYFGAFVEKKLVGCLGFSINPVAKMSHKGTVCSMYIKPECQGHNMGDGLMRAVITYAKSWVLQIQLMVVTTNHNAITLYQHHGFEIYGTEPKSLKVNDIFYDEHLMVLMLP